jgi:hypothetical protein
MQGKDAPSLTRPLFAGRRGGQAVGFICSSDGSFCIHCGADCVSIWPAGQLKEALSAYLAFVERPERLAKPSTTPSPQRLPASLPRPWPDVPPNRTTDGTTIAA